MNFLALHEDGYGFVRYVPSDYPISNGYTLKPISWQKREDLRFRFEHYRSTPDWFPTLSDHYAHVSIKNPLLIAFTESDEKGIQDRQTAMKPGRYLKKYFPHLDNINELAAKWAAEFSPPVLKIATTPEEWEYVYLAGPHSCMAYPSEYFAEYGAPMHPLAAYALGPDLQLAYVERDNRIVARTIIWPERKIFSRIYGDDTRMRAALPSDYTQSNLNGARLAKIEVHDGYLMPYVDHCRAAYDDDDYLVLDPTGGDVSTETTTGTTNSDRYCPWHDDWFSEPWDWEAVYLDGSLIQTFAWHPARIRKESWKCIYSGRRFSNTIPKHMTEDGPVAFAYLHNYETCAGSGKLVLRERMLLVRNNYYSEDYLGNLLEAA